MRLAYKDRAAPHLVYILPRRLYAPVDEDRTAYTLRFFREIRGLGNIVIGTVRGSRFTHRSARGL